MMIVPSGLALTLFGMAFLCLFVALFPFGPYQLSLLLARRVGAFQPMEPKTASDQKPLTFAICVCAYNEEAVIREKIENMLALRKAAGTLDILVYVDAASDRTADIVREYDTEVTLVASEERHGKPWGMNRLVTLTDADIVMFTDANVMVDLEAIDKLRGYFANPEIGCVTSHLSYTNPEESATSEVGSFYWRLDEWTKGVESETGSAMGADGSLFAIRRSLHRPTPGHLPDDLYVSMSILCDGYRLVRGADVRAFETHTTNPKDEFKRKIRICCQCISTHRVLWPRLKKLSVWNLYKYLGHRYVRWIGGYFLLASALLFLAAIWVGYGFVLMLGLTALFLATMLLGTLLSFRPIQQINNILVAFAGNTLGVWRSYWGEPMATWDVADSSRNDLPSNLPSR